ncbi:hypothetical protein [Janthinobacterium sp.]|uniref:hypothetical protein n=1 Tax=Janthinobacterium sp. TaxID=1871054 RepID=UPI002601D1B5|nr:hypothetical protein [Janthinobacterium sp.]
MPSLPPLQMAATSGSKNGDQGGSAGGVRGGDWIINSGAGSTSGITNKTMIIAAVGVVAWLLLKKR